MSDENDTRIRVPATFSLKDVLMAGAFITTLAIAWGFASARITYLERDYLNLKNQVVVVEEKSALYHKEIQLQIDRLDQINRSTELDTIQKLNAIDRRINRIEFLLEQQSKLVN